MGMVVIARSANGELKGSYFSQREAGEAIFGPGTNPASIGSAISKAIKDKSLFRGYYFSRDHNAVLDGGVKEAPFVPTRADGSRDFSALASNVRALVEAGFYNGGCVAAVLYPKVMCPIKRIFCIVKSLEFVGRNYDGPPGTTVSFINQLQGWGTNYRCAPSVHTSIGLNRLFLIHQLDQLPKFDKHGNSIQYHSSHEHHNGPWCINPGDEPTVNLPGSLVGTKSMVERHVNVAKSFDKANGNCTCFLHSVLDGPLCHVSGNMAHGNKFTPTLWDYHVESSGNANYDEDAVWTCGEVYGFNAKFFDEKDTTGKTKEDFKPGTIHEIYQQCQYLQRWHGHREKGLLDLQNL